MTEGPPSQRLDLWLWCARIARQRTSCAEMVVDHKVRLNRRAVEKPHAQVRPGDVVTLAWGDRVRVLRILALSERRGGVDAARMLYEEIPETP